MATICLDQALIALHAHSRMAVGWLVALRRVRRASPRSGNDLFLRVELGPAGRQPVGLRAGCRCASGGRCATRPAADEIDLAESLAELSIDI